MAFTKMDLDDSASESVDDEEDTESEEEESPKKTKMSPLMKWAMAKKKKA